MPDACTQTDTCQSGSCTGGNPVVCSPHVAIVPRRGNVRRCERPPSSNPNAADARPARCRRLHADRYMQDGRLHGQQPCGLCGQRSVPRRREHAIRRRAPARTRTPRTARPATMPTPARKQIHASRGLHGRNPVVLLAQRSVHVAGTCDPATGTCSNPNARTARPATMPTLHANNTCQSGASHGRQTRWSGGRDQCHVAGTCDPATGTCSTPNAADGKSCNDTDACTQTDTCQRACARAATCGLCGQRSVPRRGNMQSGERHLLEPERRGRHVLQRRQTPAPRPTPVRRRVHGGNPLVCSPSDQCHVAGTCDPRPAPARTRTPRTGRPATMPTPARRQTPANGRLHGSNPVVCSPSISAMSRGSAIRDRHLLEPECADGTSCNDADACTRQIHASPGLHGQQPCGLCGQRSVPHRGNMQSGDRHLLEPERRGRYVLQRWPTPARRQIHASPGLHGQQPVVCAASDQCHIAGTCNPATGTCSNRTPRTIRPATTRRLHADRYLPVRGLHGQQPCGLCGQRSVAISRNVRSGDCTVLEPERRGRNIVQRHRPARRPTPARRRVHGRQPGSLLAQRSVPRRWKCDPRPAPARTRTPRMVRLQ